MKSSDGITWSPVSSHPLTSTAFNVKWNGTRWIAVGNGTCKISHSHDGNTWYESLADTNIFSSYGIGVGVNNESIGSVRLPPSQLVLNKNGIRDTYDLDITTDNYNNIRFEDTVIAIE